MSDNELEIKDELLPKELDNLIKIDEETTSIVTDIINAEDADALKNLTKAFTLNQAKKNALRIIKLNSLLDKVNDQAIERMTKRPHEVSNKELLDYMNVVSSQIERSQKTLDKVDETPLIQVNTQTNNLTVNLNEDEISTDSRKKVISAVQELLKLATTPINTTSVEEPVFVDIAEEDKE